MSVANTVDMTCKWAHLKFWGSNQDSSRLPTLDVLKSATVVDSAYMETKKPCVFLALGERDDVDLVELRQWLKEQTIAGYKMSARFRYTVKDYTTDKIYLGVLFNFEEMNDAALCRLFWG
jgi:hypothetical protein